MRGATQQARIARQHNNPATTHLWSLARCCCRLSCCRPSPPAPRPPAATGAAGLGAVADAPPPRPWMAAPCSTAITSGEAVEEGDTPAAGAAAGADGEEE